ncbi:MAG: NYN domain-containing protein [Planctomycetota bacterium]|jgi:hypothetical protein
MPYLIDGNNLLHAMLEIGPEVGRASLCAMLGKLIEPGERICVVFDGPSPPEGLRQQIDDTGVEAVYSLDRPADDIVCQRVDDDTAPRRLSVVSSDREIRRHASRRKCQIIVSDEFARFLLRRLAERQRQSQSAEPPEKRHGLGEDQTTDDWLDFFGLDGQ